MKIGDKVKIVNSNSSFCGEIGSVHSVSMNYAMVSGLRDADISLEFRLNELEVVGE